MITLLNALDRGLAGTPPAAMRMIIAPPPALCLLPLRKMRPGSLVASIFLHGLAMAALLWLPPLFAEPVIVAQENVSKSEPLVLDEPLVLPAPPRLEDAGSSRADSGTTEASRAPSSAAASALAQTPDYTAAQTIVSDVASPVNRVQTILRPDMVTPPNLKFPLRLQSIVILPSTAAPVLAPRPAEQPAQPAPVATPEEAPAIKPTVLAAVLTLNAKKGSIIRAKTAPAPTVSPDLKTVAGTDPSALKALVVVNAVQVAPDPSTAVPQAQLAGKFVIGPSSGGTGNGNSARAPDSASPASSGIGPDVADGHASAPGRVNDAIASGKGTGNVVISPALGSSSRGTGAANGGSSPDAGTSTVSGAVPGISISGGVPGRNGAATANSFPGRPSYSLMIISGGASGGASRDLGAFTRSETVYSVSIPMADAGGGPDWTMQYALRDPAQAGRGMLVPPIAQKKVAAILKPSTTSADSGPVFVSAIIDENGKLQSLRPMRVQDTRSQVAMRALEQWEFLPAQLDGKPVASKVLVGVAVILQQ